LRSLYSAVSLVYYYFRIATRLSIIFYLKFVSMTRMLQVASSLLRGKQIPGRAAFLDGLGCIQLVPRQTEPGDGRIS
jgi:hypothetical protein